VRKKDGSPGHDGLLDQGEFVEHCATLGISQYSAEDLYQQLLPELKKGVTHPEVAKDEYMDRMTDVMAEKQEQERNVAELRAQIAGLDARIRELQAMRADLEAKGELDVQLKKRLDDQIRALEEFRAVALDFLNKLLNGEAGTTQLADDLHDSFVKVEEADEKISEVIPHDDKWFRYAFEYLFVQALLLSLILLVFFFMSFICTWLRKHLEPESWNLFSCWRNEMMYLVTLCLLSGVVVLGCIYGYPHILEVLTLAAMEALPQTGEIRVPASQSQWQLLVVKEFAYLCVTVLVYIFLMRWLVHASEEKKLKWARLDKQIEATSPKVGQRGLDDSGAKKSGFSLKRQATIFDDDVRRFDMVRKYFVSHLLDETSELHKSLTVLHGTPPTEERIREFRLSWYFRENVDFITVQLLNIASRTWFSLTVWYIFLCILAACFHMTYYVTMLVVGGVSMSVLLFMYWASVRRRNDLMDIHNGDVETPDAITSQYDFNSGILMDTMRCFILILIYGAVQFLLSKFCWTYYTLPTIVFAVMVVFFFLTWCFNWVFVVPVYAAAMSMPPFYSKQHAHLHATHITAALQDDAEWASEEEAAERGLITTPRDAEGLDLD
jgi:hypothetical protein